jgi:hypothetical protein
MKTAYRFLVLLTAVWSTNVAIAGNFDVEIHCFPKRIDQSVRTASDGGVNRPGSVGSMTSRATPRQQSGSFSIDDFKPHEKKSFSTNPVELNKSNLVGHWHYESGAKPNAQDTLVGLAMRVYQGGQQFAEFANPSTLLREKLD